MVEEAIQSQWNIEALIVSTDYLSQFVSIDPGIHTWAADPQDFKKISQQNNPEGIISIVAFPYPDFSYSRDLPHLPSGPGFMLDGIQDPGNLGTIMRIADWFGFSNVICGPGTVDLLNPKTLRSSMGAIFRVNIIYAQNFPELVKNHSQEIKIADMNGENPNQTDWNE
ncbi:MAG: RNA methyltransferase, partial [Bacteroidetes bacterium]|nr:RNA methyltransferase [Bacteroidota bacterium]